jgi:hypothetical protein
MDSVKRSGMQEIQLDSNSMYGTSRKCVHPLYIWTSQLGTTISYISIHIPSTHESVFSLGYGYLMDHVRYNFWYRYHASKVWLSIAMIFHFSLFATLIYLAW